MLYRKSDDFLASVFLKDFERYNLGFKTVLLVSLRKKKILLLIFRGTFRELS